MHNLDTPKDDHDKGYIVTVSINNLNTEGILRIPHNARGIVLFAHGGGSSRYSPRNNFVAAILRQARVGTLLFDLLTEEESLVYENRFNIELLTQRLIGATQWVFKQSRTKNLPVGFFGASTGSAATLKAAARIGSKIRAIVSRGGRPDLAMDSIGQVKSSTLLIVGEEDPEVIGLNQQAYQALNTTKKMEIVPGAGHLFEESGALQKVGELARDWFKKYLARDNKGAIDL